MHVFTPFIVPTEKVKTAEEAGWGVARVVLVSGIILWLALFVMQPVSASHCTGDVTVTGTVEVPQAKNKELRVGRLMDMQGEGGLLAATEVMYHYIPYVGGAGSPFVLQATDVGADFCNLTGDGKGVHTADFDITFFYQSGDTIQVLARYDICGNESGTVPESASFAIVWLSAGSLPARAFSYRACHDI